MFPKFFGFLFKNQVIFGLFILALAWFIVQTRDIIVSLFISYIIMSGILPAVEFLRKKRFPQILSVFIPYISILILLFLIVLPMISEAVKQVDFLVTRFPRIFNEGAQSIGLHIDPKQLEVYFNDQLGTIGRNAITVTTKVFGGIFSVLTIAIVSFYLLMYHDAFKKFIASLFRSEMRPRVLATLYKVDEKLGAWLRGQLFLMVFIGTLTWVVLTLLGIPYALPLAILAGLLEIVPTIGPIMSAIPSVIIGLTISPIMAAVVALAYICIQAIENYLLVPNVMHRAVGLNPVVIILSIIVGANLLGVAGALLAVPFISFIMVIFESVDGESK